jgi:ABC-type glycerol-3-phosphate transport system substrate-binding protein
MGAASTLLGACASPTPEVVEKIVEVEKTVEVEVEKLVETTVEVEKVVEKTVEVEKIVEVGNKEVRYLTETWNWEKLNMANATDHYNQQLRADGIGTAIVVDPAPDGWDTKVAQMVKDNELLWNGHLRATNLGDVPRRNRLGILQPWDEYINSSTVPWAGQFWDEVLPNVAESFKIDGKLYAFPWDGELYCRVYNKPIWDTIGETPAETLDEFERQLEAILEANPDKTPMCLRHHDGHPDQHMLMQLWTDNPWIEVDGAGILDVKSEAYANMLTMLKRWYDKGLITDDSWGGTLYDSWNTGNTATGQSGAAWLQATAQKVFGISNIVPMTNFVINAGDQPKTTTFANGAMLFAGAANPQEVTDWLLWMLDPTVEKVANYSAIRGILNYYHIPMYQSVYDNILSTDASWAWMSDVLGMVKASATYPANAMTNEIVPIINVWEQKFVHGEVNLNEAVDGMYDEFMDAVKKALEA